MPVLQFRLTLDIQIAVFFVEIKHIKKLIPFSQLIVESHNSITSHLFVVNCVVVVVVAMPLSVSYVFICRSCLRLFQLV